MGAGLNRACPPKRPAFRRSPCLPRPMACRCRPPPWPGPLCRAHLPPGQAGAAAPRGPKRPQAAPEAPRVLSLISSCRPHSPFWSAVRLNPLRFFTIHHAPNRHDLTCVQPSYARAVRQSSRRPPSSLLVLALHALAISITPRRLFSPPFPYRLCHVLPSHSFPSLSLPPQTAPNTTVSVDTKSCISFKTPIVLGQHRNPRSLPIPTSRESTSNRLRPTYRIATSPSRS